MRRRASCPPQNCPGNRRWIQLVFDAMLLDPVAPTMIDARNSMLAADMMRYGGANQMEIWRAFAQRGLGRTRHEPAPRLQPLLGNAVQDCDPVPDFASPVESNVEVTFDLVEKSPGDPPVVGKVYVGHYEGRASPIADTDPATANSGIDVNHDAVAHFAPGRVRLPGRGEGSRLLPVQRRPEGRPARPSTVRLPLELGLVDAGCDRDR